MKIKQQKHVNPASSQIQGAKTEEVHEKTTSGIGFDDWFQSKPTNVYADSPVVVPKNPNQGQVTSLRNGTVLSAMLKPEPLSSQEMVEELFHFSQAASKDIESAGSLVIEAGEAFGKENLIDGLADTWQERAFFLGEEITNQKDVLLGEPAEEQLNFLQRVSSDLKALGQQGKDFLGDVRDVLKQGAQSLVAGADKLEQGIEETFSIADRLAEKAKDFVALETQVEALNSKGDKLSMAFSLEGSLAIATASVGASLDIVHKGGTPASYAVSLAGDLGVGAAFELGGKLGLKFGGKASISGSGGVGFEFDAKTPKEAREISEAIVSLFQGGEEHIEATEFLRSKLSTFEVSGSLAGKLSSSAGTSIPGLKELVGNASLGGNLSIARTVSFSFPKEVDKETGKLPSPQVSFGTSVSASGAATLGGKLKEEDQGTLGSTGTGGNESFRVSFSKTYDIPEEFSLTMFNEEHVGYVKELIESSVLKEESTSLSFGASTSTKLGVSQDITGVSSSRSNSIGISMSIDLSPEDFVRSDAMKDLLEGNFAESFQELEGKGSAVYSKDTALKYGLSLNPELSLFGIGFALSSSYGWEDHQKSSEKIGIEKFPLKYKEWLTEEK